MPRLHWRQLLGFSGVSVGIIGFILVGIVCLGSIGYGVYQTLTHKREGADHDTGGSGTVLTVLGMYFSVPYVLILGAFIYAVFDFKVLSPGAHFWTMKTTVTFATILFLIQQGFTNVYLVLIHGYGALGILVADFVVLAMFIGWKLCPNTCVAYVILFAVKMGLVWGEAWKFADEPVFGPSGFATLLFICVPIIQLTLFSPTVENEGISQAYVSRFNIATTHLLHSLDIISFFTFCFHPLQAEGAFAAVPLPLRWLMLLLVLIAFAANNLGLPLLFFRRSFRSLQLPDSVRNRLRSYSTAGGAGGGAGDTAAGSGGVITGYSNTASHYDFNALSALQQSQSGGLGGGGSVGSGNNSPTRGSGGAASDQSLLGIDGEGQNPVVVTNENEQMLTFMIMMLMLCDFPFLAARFALWANNIDRMNVFAAKNLKDMLDVLFLLSRAESFS